MVPFAHEAALCAFLPVLMILGRVVFGKRGMWTMLATGIAVIVAANVTGVLIQPDAAGPVDHFTKACEWILSVSVFGQLVVSLMPGQRR
jgi:hypothetical protein